MPKFTLLIDRIDSKYFEIEAETLEEAFKKAVWEMSWEIPSESDYHAASGEKDGVDIDWTILDKLNEHKIG